MNPSTEPATLAEIEAFLALARQLEAEPCELVFHHSRQGGRRVEVIWPSGRGVTGQSQFSAMDAMTDCAARLADHLADWVAA